MSVLNRQMLTIHVAFLTAVESFVMFLVLRLLNQEVVEQGRLKVLVFMLMSSVTVIKSLLNAELVAELNSLWVMEVRLRVRVLESVVNGVFVEVNRLDILSIIESVVECVMVFVDSVHREIDRVVLSIVVRIVVHLTVLVMLGLTMMGSQVMLLDLLDQIFDSFDILGGLDILDRLYHLESFFLLLLKRFLFVLSN